MHLTIQRNLGTIDRFIRVFLGIVLIYLAACNPLITSNWLNLLLGAIGLAMMVEGILAY